MSTIFNDFYFDHSIFGFANAHRFHAVVSTALNDKRNGIDLFVKKDKGRRLEKTVILSVASSRILT